MHLKDSYHGLVIIVFLFVITALLFSSYSTKNVVCNVPYITVGNQCCFDSNNNKICDSDELAQGTQAVAPLGVVSTTTIVRTIIYSDLPEKLIVSKKQLENYAGGMWSDIGSTSSYDNSINIEDCYANSQNIHVCSGIHVFSTVGEASSAYSKIYDELRLSSVRMSENVVGSNSVDRSIYSSRNMMVVSDTHLLSSKTVDEEIYIQTSNIIGVVKLFGYGRDYLNADEEQLLYDSLDNLILNIKRGDNIYLAKNENSTELPKL